MPKHSLIFKAEVDGTEFEFEVTRKPNLRFKLTRGRVDCPLVRLVKIGEDFFLDLKAHGNVFHKDFIVKFEETNHLVSLSQLGG